MEFIFTVSGFPDFMASSLWLVIFQRRTELLAEFQWFPDFKSKISDQIVQSLRNRTFSVIVGVHVRLQDFGYHLNLLYGKSKLADEIYFDNAMKYYRWVGPALLANDVIYLII